MREKPGNRARILLKALLLTLAFGAGIAGMLCAGQKKHPDSEQVKSVSQPAEQRMIDSTKSTKSADQFACVSAGNVLY